MHTIPTEAHKLETGDKVTLVLHDEADRMGTVTVNHRTARTVDLVGDNLVSMSVPYRKIARIEKIVADPGDPAI